MSTSPPTRRLELEDPHLLEFTATVLSCEAQAGDRHEVILDRSAFYPTGGGQPHDTGTLSAARVIDVAKRGETVLHRIEGGPVAGEIAGRVDGPRRRDHRQQHTGQHLLSAAFTRTYGANTVSFHLGAAHSTIDLDRRVGPDEIARAEAAANAVIEEDRPVTVQMVDRDRLEEQGLRKINLPDGVGASIRIVTIIDWDRSHCGGTHCRRTGEIRLVKILATESVKGGLTRVSFLCGDRALDDYAARSDVLLKLAALGTTSWKELPAIFESRLQSQKQLEKQVGRFSEEAARALAAARPPDGRTAVRFETAPLPFLRTLATELVARGAPAALVLGPSANRPGKLFAMLALRDVDASTGDAGAIVRDWVERFGGRGGGRGATAQIDDLSLESAEQIVAAFEDARHA